ncbi:MAG: hypothetical protein RBR15_10100 [Sphaerochaeta sp.]|nr:hypothetical protein [Sphaerochaeta sp.]
MSLLSLVDRMGFALPWTQLKAIRDFEGKDSDGVGIGSSDVVGGDDIAENVAGMAQSQTLWSFSSLCLYFPIQLQQYSLSFMP